MKKNKITLTLLLTLLMVLIVGCSAQPETAQMSDDGTLILSVNPSIAVNYTKDGSVIEVEALNDDGEIILENYADFEGKETRDVVVELVQKIIEAGYLVDDVEQENRQITIEIERNSVMPNDKFINEIATSVKEMLAQSNLNNPIRVPREGDSDYNDLTDYSDYSDYLDPKVDDTDYDTDYDDTDYDTDYDATNYDTDYDDSDYGQVAPQPAPAPALDTDYTDYDDSDYNQPAPKPVTPPTVDTDYSDYDDSDYDVSDYDDSDYDDSDYDDSDYD